MLLTFRVFLYTNPKIQSQKIQKINIMLTLSSPAKINIYLHITGKRNDGYHLLDTVFQLVNIYDKITLNLRNDGNIVLHTPIEYLPNEQHLAVRAANLLQFMTQSSFGADIWVDKHIPLGAGLGGGSSNAATTLMGLNKLWNCGLHSKQLQDLGIQLGADVPFFCSQYGTAHAQGIGEVLTKIPTPSAYYVIIFPNTPISTQSVFKQFNLTCHEKYTIMSKLSNNSNCIFENTFKNVLQDTAKLLNSSITDAINSLEKTDNALAIRMSGTGSSVFAAYQTEYDAIQAVKQLNSFRSTKKWTVFSVNPLPFHPNINKLNFFE